MFCCWRHQQKLKAQRPVIWRALRELSLQPAVEMSLVELQMNSTGQKYWNIRQGQENSSKETTRVPAKAHKPQRSPQVSPEAGILSTNVFPPPTPSFSLLASPRRSSVHQQFQGGKALHVSFFLDVPKCWASANCSGAHGKSNPAQQC